MNKENSKVVVSFVPDRDSITKVGNAVSNGIKKSVKSIDLGKELSRNMSKINIGKGLSKSIKVDVKQINTGIAKQLSSQTTQLKQAGIDMGDVIGAGMVVGMAKSMKGRRKISADILDSLRRTGSYSYGPSRNKTSRYFNALKTRTLDNIVGMASSNNNEMSKIFGETVISPRSTTRSNPKTTFSTSRKETPSTSNSLGGGAAVAATAGFIGLSAAIGGVLSTGSKFRKFNNILNNTLGSKTSGNAAFTILQQLATKLPLTLEEVTDGYIKLINRGIKPSNAEITQLTDVALSQGKSLNQYIEAVLDAQTGENERLKEFGIKANVSGDKVSYTFKGVTTTFKKGEKAIYDYLVGLGKLGGVAGSAAIQMDTLEGKLSNFKDTMDKIKFNIFEGSAENSAKGFMDIVNNIAGGIERITKSSPLFTDMFTSTFTVGVVAGLGYLAKGALGAGLAAIGTTFTALGSVIAVAMSAFLVVHDLWAIMQNKPTWLEGISKELDKTWGPSIEKMTEQKKKFDLLGTKKGAKDAGLSESQRIWNMKRGEELGLAIMELRKSRDLNGKGGTNTTPSVTDLKDIIGGVSGLSGVSGSKNSMVEQQKETNKLLRIGNDTLYDFRPEDIREQLFLKSREERDAFLGTSRGSSGAVTNNYNNNLNATFGMTTQAVKATETVGGLFKRAQLV